jgi:hypothetical protein
VSLPYAKHLLVDGTYACPVDILQMPTFAEVLESLSAVTESRTSVGLSPGFRMSPHSRASSQHRRSDGASPLYNIGTQ